MNLSLTDWLAAAVVVLLVASWLPAVVSKLKFKIKPSGTAATPEQQAWIVPTAETAKVSKLQGEDYELYRCFRALMARVEGCANATEALRYIVLPALIVGADPPHYRVDWTKAPDVVIPKPE